MLGSIAFIETKTESAVQDSEVLGGFPMAAARRTFQTSTAENLSIKRPRIRERDCSRCPILESAGVVTLESRSILKTLVDSDELLRY